jgi:hypothetical protein
MLGLAIMFLKAFMDQALSRYSMCIVMRWYSAYIGFQLIRTIT